MYIFGVYISVVDLLIVFTGLVVVILLYLAYEVNKLKKLEKRFSSVEKMLEIEEKRLEKDISKMTGKKRKARKKPRVRTRKR